MMLQLVGPDDCVLLFFAQANWKFTTNVTTIVKIYQFVVCHGMNMKYQRFVCLPVSIDELMGMVGLCWDGLGCVGFVCW